MQEFYCDAQPNFSRSIYPGSILINFMYLFLQSMGLIFSMANRSKMTCPGDLLLQRVNPIQ